MSDNGKFVLAEGYAADPRSKALCEAAQMIVSAAKCDFVEAVHQVEAWRVAAKLPERPRATRPARQQASRVTQSPSAADSSVVTAELEAGTRTVHIAGGLVRAFPRGRQ